MEETGSQPLRIGDCYVHPEQRTIERAAETIKVRPKAMDVLVHLVHNAPNVVKTESLIERFWAPTVVGDDAVQVVIHELRQALGDTAKQSNYIKTFPKRGYQLVADVAPAQAASTKAWSNTAKIAAAVGVESRVTATPS
jgi:DNA-binding winged helix-turn-helix (wHTH) protein